MKSPDAELRLLPVELADDELQLQARHWRALAARGERAAFGRAHELEVAWRRRVAAGGRIHAQIQNPLAP